MSLRRIERLAYHYTINYVSDTSHTFRHVFTFSDIFVHLRSYTHQKLNKNKTPEIPSCFNCFLTFYGLEKKVSISLFMYLECIPFLSFYSLIWGGSNRRIKYIKNYTVNCFKCFKCTFYVSFSSIIFMFYSRIPNDFLSNENLLSAL